MTPRVHCDNLLLVIPLGKWSDIDGGLRVGEIGPEGLVFFQCKHTLGKIVGQRQKAHVPMLGV